MLNPHPTKGFHSRENSVINDGDNYCFLRLGKNKKSADSVLLII